MPFSPESTFTIAVSDLDVSLLPEHAREPHTDTFRNAVTDLIRSEYTAMGGQARVLIDDKASTIQVTWWPGAGQPSPLDVAISKLERGEYQEAVRLLEILRFQQPQNPAVYYNLGMSLSDLGRFDLAVKHLRRALAIAPGHANCLVALGVALGRQQKLAEAIQTFRRALVLEADNPWAHRNLGSCLLKAGGDANEAEGHLRRAVGLLSTDQQALFGLGQALLALGRAQEADVQFIKAIAQNDRTPIADLAKRERSRLAESSFSKAGGGHLGGRMDAVMYCLAALEQFEGMPREEVQKIGFEIAILGQRGLNTNDSTQKHTLRSMTGQFSSLQLVAIMYVAFKIIAPDQDIGFDLSKEYKAALGLHRKGG